MNAKRGSGRRAEIFRGAGGRERLLLLLVRLDQFRGLLAGLSVGVFLHDVLEAGQTDFVGFGGVELLGDG